MVNRHGQPCFFNTTKYMKSSNNCRCIVEYVDATEEEIKEMNADENTENVDSYEEKGYNKDEDKVKRVLSDEEIALEIAKEQIEAIKPSEKTITKDLKAIAKSNGSELAGLEYRFKSTESLTRKILLDAKERGISLEEAADQITDKLRYTFVSNTEKFTEDYFNTINEFAKKNYKVIRVKNTFKDGATYKGINTLVKNKNGVIFELQYHTPQSISIKENELHKLYEEQRVLDKVSDKEKWDALNNQMIELCKKIQNPTGVERIK